jgi:Ran GTPase-activating protein (RanGAP) involved in mRNA processing and transport
VISENRCARLALSGDPVSADQATALAAALRTNTALTHLNLGNVLGKKVPVSTKGEVRFEYEGKPWLDSAGLVQVLASVPENVQNFYLGRNQMDAAASAALAALVRRSSSIVDLQVVGADMDFAGAEAVAAALRAPAPAGGSALRSLSLKACELGPEGAVVLAQALGQAGAGTIGAGLTKLDLGSNAVGNGGAEAVGEMLEGNAALEVLGLFGNEIGVAGVAALRRGLSANTRLHTLYLVNNHLGARGAKELGALLRANVGLTHVYCAGNGMGAKGAAHLLSALRTNALVQELSFGVGDWKWQGHSEVGALLARNKAWAAAGAVNKEVIQLYHRQNQQARLDKVEAALDSCIGKLARANGGGQDGEADEDDEEEDPDLQGPYE